MRRQFFENLGKSVSQSTKSMTFCDHGLSRFMYSGLSRVHDLLVTVLAIFAGPPATCDGAAILNAAAGLRDRPKPLRDTGWPMMLAFDPL